VEADDSGLYVVKFRDRSRWSPNLSRVKLDAPVCLPIPEIVFIEIDAAMSAMKPIRKSASRSASMEKWKPLRASHFSTPQTAGI
jgi:hypothetical protein